MNTLIITAALALSTLFHGEPPTSKSEVKQKIEHSLSAIERNLPLEINQNGLVRVSLKVDENGKLQILEADYSHEELKNLLADRLALITIDNKTDDVVYYYEFRFEKH